MIRLQAWLLRLVWWFIELRARWYRWRRGQICVCASVRIHSISTDGQEQLMGAISGAVFSEVAAHGHFRLRVSAGGEVAIEVENLTRSRLPFAGMFEMATEFGREILPIPPTVLEPTARRVIRLRVIRGGFFNALVIPTFLSRLKGKHANNQ